MLLVVGVSVSFSAPAFSSPAIGVVPKADWAALSKQAEVAKLAGRLSDAAELYAHAARANPTQAIPAEGACEVALALEAEGKGFGKTSSRDACRRAYTLLGTPENTRNEVASLMSPGQRPSLDDLVDAALLADSEIHVNPDRPWGFLARCDIARRMGSAEVLETCLADLRRIAPDHAATKQALASVREPASFGRWIVRALLLLTLLGTLAHALLHRRRSLRHPRPLFDTRVAAVLVAAFSVLSGPGIRAARAEAGKAANGNSAHLNVRKDQLSQGPIDDADPEASVPSPEERDKAPLQFGYLIQDLAGRAEQAIKRGDHAAAARYFKALSKATPDSSYGPRKLCEELEAEGDIATAIMACRTAITLSGATAGDFARFVDLVLATRGPLPPLERKELEAVVAQVSKEPNLGALPAMLRCQVALRFEDQTALEACTTDLKKLAPDDPRTISFRWALALQKKDKSGALQLITKARDAGMSGDGLAMMEKATRQMARRQIGRLVVFGAGGLLVVLLGAIGFRHLNGRRGSGGSGRPLPVA